MLIVQIDPQPGDDFRQCGARPAWRHWLWPYLCVAAITLVAHLPEIGGWVSCNPLYRYSGMVLQPVHQLLPGSCSMDHNDGTTLQALGGRAAAMWLQARLPWWNSYAGLGLPLGAEAQPAVFFLPFVLLLHFYSGMLILKICMQLMAGAGMIALLREIGVGRSGSAVGGMLFALNGSFAWFAHSPILPIAFLPALLFGVERCQARAVATRPGGPIWVALALTFSLLAGAPETAFMNGLLAAVWAIMAVLRTPAQQRWALSQKIACGGVAGLALSAPAWVSFLDYLRVSGLGAHGFVVLNHIAPQQAPVFLLPGFYGPPYMNGATGVWTDCGGYFGAAFATLSLLGLLSGRRAAPLRWAMAGWVIFWLAVFFGVPVAHGVWRSAPVLNQVQITRYAMPSMECAGAILAALGVDDWCVAVRNKRILWAGIAVAGLVAAALMPAAQAGRIWSSTRGVETFETVALLQALAVTGSLTWLIAQESRRECILGVMLIVALDSTANFMLPELAGARHAKLALAPVRFLLAHAKLGRIYALEEQLPVNYGSWFAVAQIQADSVPYANAWDDAATSIGGYINMSTSGLQAAVPKLQIAAFRAAAVRLQSAGVRFVVVAAGRDPFVANPVVDMLPVFADARTRIYEMPGAADYMEVHGGPCTMTIVTREQAVTDCVRPAALLRRELFLTGWYASINGRETAITSGALSGETEFQQVMLPAGRTNVVWWYSPPHSALIAWLCGSGALATLLLAYHEFYRGRVIHYKGSENRA